MWQLQFVDDLRHARSETLWWSRYLNVFVRKDLLEHADQESPTRR